MPVAGAGYGFARRALGPLGGFATGHGDPHRVRHRAGGDRGVHRRLRRGAGPVRADQRLAGLPRLLPDLRRRPPVGRRRGAEGDVRDHRHRGRRAGRVRRRHAPAVRRRRTSSTSSRPAPPAPATSCRSASPACWPRSSTASGSSSRSRACRWRPRRRATRAATCRAASSPRWWCSLVFAALMLVTAPGGAGSSAIAGLRQPAAHWPSARPRRRQLVAEFVNYVGLAGLIASFFSIVFAYSRQLFALSRAGYLPRWLSRDRHRARRRTWR